MAGSFSGRAAWQPCVRSPVTVTVGVLVEDAGTMRNSLVS
jgi:hypothetical protein